MRANGSGCGALAELGTWREPASRLSGTRSSARRLHHGTLAGIGGLTVDPVVPHACSHAALLACTIKRTDVPPQQINCCCSDAGDANGFRAV